MNILKSLAILLVLVSSSLVGCSSSDLDASRTAEGAFKVAEELEKDELYEQAIKKYAEVRNKHPYSRYAVRSELKIADVQFKREYYREAQDSYALFKELHPRHPQIAYVTYRLARSYERQLPSSIDRDLSQASKALLYFDEVITSYKNSEYAKKSLEHKVEIRKKLAQKEYYIGNFYFIRDHFLSALLRFEKLAKNYPESAVASKALLRAGKSALEIDEPKRALKNLNRLVRLYSDTAEAAEGGELIKKYGLL